MTLTENEVTTPATLANLAAKSTTTELLETPEQITGEAKKERKKPVFVDNDAFIKFLKESKASKLTQTKAKSLFSQKFGASEGAFMARYYAQLKRFDNNITTYEKKVAETQDEVKKNELMSILNRLRNAKGVIELPLGKRGRQEGEASESTQLEDLLAILDEPEVAVEPTATVTEPAATIESAAVVVTEPIPTCQKPGHVVIQAGNATITVDTDGE